MDYLLFALPAMLLSAWASWKTNSAFKKYSNVRSERGITGAQAAQTMLARAGITDVKVVRAQGFLSDHYNPLTKSLALSEPVHDSMSVAAVGVATHEAGHAIQHARKYAPLWLRSALVPTANIGSNFGMLVLMAGFMMQSRSLVMVGVIMFSAVVLFQLVTLPVEFDASARAKKLCVEYGIIGSHEREGVDKVLNAAAMTYVAAAVGSVMTLLYYLLRSGLLGGRRDE